jgi:anti-sigma factor RsiW
MSSQLHQLNNESILLLYLAGELSAEDRADVEQHLAADPQFHEELETLRVAYDGAGESLAAADKSERLVLPEASAARRVGNAVRSWHARRLSMPPAEAQRRGLRFPWWWYVTASAAGLVVITVSLSKILGDRMPLELKPLVPIATNDDPSSAPSDPELVETFDEQYVELPPPESDAVLDEAEDELYALSEPAVDASGIMLPIGETDER